MTGDSMRVSATYVMTLFEINNLDEFSFSGYTGKMYQSILRKIRNSGINVNVSQFSVEEMISQFIANETDIAIPFHQPMLKTEFSSEIFEWGGLFYSIENNIISGGKIGVKYDPFQIIDVFQTKVWICIFFFLILSSFVLAVSNIVNVPQTRKSSIVKQVVNSALVILALLCNQGVGYSFRSYSQRILRNACLFAAFAIYYFACCNLLTSLTSAEKPKYINNLQDLLSTPQSTFYMARHSFLYKLFSNSDFPLEKAAYEQAVRTGGLFGSAIDIISEAIENVEKGTGVFLLYKILVLKEMATILGLLDENTFLHISEEPVQIEWFSVPSRKGFNKTLKELFYRSVSWYVESGTLEQDLLSDQSSGIRFLEDCHARNREPIQGMVMNNTILPLIILACGWLLALTQISGWAPFRRRNKSRIITHEALISRLQDSF